MSNDDLATLKLIRSQLLERIQEISAQPRPSYALQGQQVHWQQYLEALQRMLAWCDHQIRAAEPAELHTQGETP